MLGFDPSQMFWQRIASLTVDATELWCAALHYFCKKLTRVGTLSKGQRNEALPSQHQTEIMTAGPGILLQDLWV